MKSLRTKKKNGKKRASAADAATIGHLTTDSLLNRLQEVEDALTEARDYLLDSAHPTMGTEPSAEYVLTGLSYVRSALMSLDNLRRDAIKEPRVESAVSS